MPRGLEDVACSICMDSLFCGRNDLDEILPISTTSCGHPFHDSCIRNWFDTQLKTRREAAARAGRNIKREPGLLCPTCRSPCSKDLLTPPQIQRIFVNVAGDGDTTVASSSRSQLLSSSPFRSPKDQQVLGLARRARDLQDEVGKLDVKSEPRLVEETLVKVERLTEEVASDKALQSVKDFIVQTYLGGLTKAINTFRSALQDNPLTPTLKALLRDMQGEISRQQMQYEDHLTKTLPEAVERARRDERNVYLQRLAEERKQRDLIQAEYEKEKVARRLARSARIEMEAEAAKKASALEADLKRKEEERQALATTLAERTKLLRFAQAKAEDRRDLKGKVKELEEEVARLRSEAIQHASRPNQSRGHHSPLVSRHISRSSQGLETSSDPLDMLRDDLDQAEDISFPTIRYSSDRRGQHGADESLHVDLPVSEDSLYASTSKPSTTARTYAFDLESPKRTKAGSSRMPSSDDSGIEMLPKVVAGGSKRPAQMSPGPKSRTNPFSAGQPPSRRLLKSSSTSTIRLGASTGEGKITSLRQPLQPRLLRTGDVAGKDRGKITGYLDMADANGRTKLGAAEDSGRKDKGKITGYLDMTDANGRPKKGVVSGVKVRRLA